MLLLRLSFLIKVGLALPACGGTDSVTLSERTPSFVLDETTKEAARPGNTISAANPCGIGGR
jgi:hypothetical protein